MFCVRSHTGPQFIVSSEGLLGRVESAHNLISAASASAKFNNNNNNNNNVWNLYSAESCKATNQSIVFEHSISTVQWVGCLFFGM